MAGVIVQAHGRLKEDKREFKANLGYILRPWLKKIGRDPQYQR